MFFLLGLGEKVAPKKGGKTIMHTCPSCELMVPFREVVKVEYISLFFIPVLEAEAKSKAVNPTFQCPNCEAAFIFSQKQFDQSSEDASFRGFMNRMYGKWKNSRGGRTENYQQEPASSRTEAPQDAFDVDKELERLKRKVEAQKKSGDRL